MKLYNWQQADWPHFRYDLSKAYPLLLKIAEKNGREKFSASREESLPHGIGQLKAIGKLKDHKTQ